MPAPRHATSTARISDELRPRGPVQLVFSETSSEDGYTIVPTGELDLLTAPRFSARIDELVRHQTGTLRLDLRALSFVDSAGLHVLLNAQRRLTRQGRRLEVICADGPVLRTIQLARLTETLNVARDD
jgi:anti-sigma B factor antagonist